MLLYYFVFTFDGLFPFMFNFILLFLSTVTIPF